MCTMSPHKTGLLKTFHVRLSSLFYKSLKTGSKLAGKCPASQLETTLDNAMLIYTTDLTAGN